MDMTICTLVGLRYHIFSTWPPYPWKLFPWARHARIPEELTFHEYANSAELLKAMPIACYEEQISLRAVHLSGGAGPCGVDGTTFFE
jgi:hypothetical protein